MMRSFQSAAVAAGLLATLSSGAAQAADLFQFDDTSENVRLLLNGVLVTGNGGSISNFSFSTVPEPGGGNGEVIVFDYHPMAQIPLLFDGTTNGLPYIYTQLYEPSQVAGQVIVSDEFGIRPMLDGAGQPTGWFNVAFTSADQALIAQQFPGIMPSPLSALELNGYQPMGYIMEHAATNDVVATFQVNSVPEPTTWLTLLAGLGALALRLSRSRPA